MLKKTFFSEHFLQAIDSLHTLLSCAEEFWIIFLNEPMRKKIQQDLEGNPPQPVWQDIFFNNKTVTLWCGAAH